MEKKKKEKEKWSPSYFEDESTLSKKMKQDIVMVIFDKIASISYSVFCGLVIVSCLLSVKGPIQGKAKK